MPAAVDKADTAQFTQAEVLNPQGWVLLNVITDPRTGLGRARAFRISNYALMMDLIAKCRRLTIEEVLASPDVQERGALTGRTSRCSRRRSCGALACTAHWCRSICATRTWCMPATGS